MQLVVVVTLIAQISELHVLGWYRFAFLGLTHGRLSYTAFGWAFLIHYCLSSHLAVNLRNTCFVKYACRWNFFRVTLHELSSGRVIRLQLISWCLHSIKWIVMTVWVVLRIRLIVLTLLKGLTVLVVMFAYLLKATVIFWKIGVLILRI